MSSMSCIKLFLSFAVLPSIFSFARKKRFVEIERKDFHKNIVIIGGGIGGLTTAKFLEKKGYKKITLLEKDSSVGGKCKSSTYDGYPGVYEQGAVLVFKYPYIESLLDEFDLELSPINVSTTLVDPGYPSQKEYWQSSKLKIDFTEEERKDFTLEVLKYARLVRRHRDLNNPGNRKIPKRICITFSEWCKRNNITMLQRIFVTPVTLYGYGYLGDEETDKIPLPYVMKEISYEQVLLLIKFIASFRENADNKEIKKYLRESDDCEHCVQGGLIKQGYGALTQKIAESLVHTRVITSANITLIERSSDGVVVEWKQGDNNQVSNSAEKFDSMIVTFHQTLKNLQASNMNDLTRHEKELFGQVRTRTYFTFTAPTNCFTDEKGLYEFVLRVGSSPIENPQINVTIRDGEPSYIFFPEAKGFNGNSMGVFYAYSTNDISLSEAKENLVSFMIRVCNSNSSTLFTVEDIRDENKWYDYFPHVSHDSLADGFYDKVHRLQGKSNTYWAGSLFNFEITEATVAYSDYLVNSFF